MSNLAECITVIENKFREKGKNIYDIPKIQIWHLITHIAHEEFQKCNERGEPGYEPIGITVKGEE